MEQWGIAPGACDWFLIASRGDMVAGIRPGMQLNTDFADRVEADEILEVRVRLINRTLAELAGGRLDDARGSLQAAADAGADPRLVTELQAEIDYRQGLTDARSS